MKTPYHSHDIDLLLLAAITMSQVRAQAGVCRWISEPDLLASFAALDAQWQAFLFCRARRLLFLRLLRRHAEALSIGRFGSLRVEEPDTDRCPRRLIWVI